ncbi:MAG: hypothetical protein QHC65_16255 [Sphingomonas sp.]|nr:hypothetical protein [Sphingomonas sp.]MDX3885977.1 hypothetical protein [Sphingomonas sp.]
MSDPGWSVGEVGGVFAGAVTLLATLGGGIKWLFDWGDRRAEGRQAKLQKWHDELEAREARLDAERASEIASLREAIARLSREHGALANAYQLIANALRVIDAGNPTLRMADELLRKAFPADPATPVDMIGALGRIDQAASQP